MNRKGPAHSSSPKDQLTAMEVGRRADVDSVPVTWAPDLGPRPICVEYCWPVEM